MVKNAKDKTQICVNAASYALHKVKTHCNCITHISCQHCTAWLQVPDGVDWSAVVKNAMDKYSLEISGGLGGTAGKVWRVGLMGYNAKPEKVELVLAAFRDGLKQQGKLK